MAMLCNLTIAPMIHYLVMSFQLMICHLSPSACRFVLVHVTTLDCTWTVDHGELKTLKVDRVAPLSLHLGLVPPLNA